MTARSIVGRSTSAATVALPGYPLDVQYHAQSRIREFGLKRIVDSPQWRGLRREKTGSGGEPRDSPPPRPHPGKPSERFPSVAPHWKRLRATSHYVATDENHVAGCDAREDQRPSGTTTSRLALDVGADLAPATSCAMLLWMLPTRERRASSVCALRGIRRVVVAAVPRMCSGQIRDQTQRARSIVADRKLTGRRDVVLECCTLNGPAALPVLTY